MWQPYGFTPWIHKWQLLFFLVRLIRVDSTACFKALLMQWGLEAFRKDSGPKPSKSKKHVANHVCDRWAQQEILTGRFCLSGTESLGTTSFIHLRMYICNLYRTFSCILYKLYDVQYTCCTFMLYILFSAYTSAPRAEGGCKHTPNTSLRSLTERKNNKWTTYNIHYKHVQPAKQRHGLVYNGDSLQKLSCFFIGVQVSNGSNPRRSSHSSGTRRAGSVVECGSVLAYSRCGPR